MLGVQIMANRKLSRLAPGRHAQHPRTTRVQRPHRPQRLKCVYSAAIGGKTEDAAVWRSHGCTHCEW